MSGRGLILAPAARALCAGAVLFLWATAAPAQKLQVDAGRLSDDIRQLSSAEFGGRGSGTPSLDRAAQYIAKQFAEAGVKPLPGYSYLHPFSITTQASLEAGNQVSYRSGSATKALDSDAFLPFSFSGTGSAAGPLVFAGYGITAPECGYDDFAGLDVKGKIVLVLKHEPREFDGDSPFEGRVYSEHSQYLSKALNARAHGARAVLLVNDTAVHTNSDPFEPFLALPAPGDPGIPYVQVKSDVVEAWFRTAGRDFAEVQRQIDRTITPASFEFPREVEVAMTVAITRKNLPVNNVAAYIPGRSNEYVIVGAHYDHLGTGEQYSLSPSQAGAVHPGADDNASGSAGVLAIARTLARRGPLPRGVLFLAFAGEELGLLGSVHWVNSPPLPLADAVAMINMDMIGRMKDSRVVVGGAGSGDRFQSLLTRASRLHKIALDTSEQAVYGSSDHTSFRARSVPVLFFFTGLHGDYHRPSDTWDKIEMRNTATLLGLVASLTEDLCREPLRPRFVSIPARGKPESVGGAAGAGSVGTNSEKIVHELPNRSR